MRLIKPSVEIESEIDGNKILKFIEKIGRVCYKSEDRITQESSKKFVQDVIKRGHLSVIEHFNITVRFITDRGVTHELVRHRLCSFSQESTRYVNYSKKGIEFILPPWVTDIPCGVYGYKVNNHGDFVIDPPKEYVERLTTLPEVNKSQSVWLYSLLEAEKNYNSLIDAGWKPQEARSVLPNALKTEIVTTANLREWRHILTLRTSAAAHPQIKEVMNVLLKDLKYNIPIVFDDIVV